MSTPILTEQQLVDLLALPTQTEQFAQLRTYQLWHETGVAHLLEQAEQLVQRNPGQAHQLALLAEQSAVQVAATACLPRVFYLRAQCHAINGELAEALTLVDRARVGFLQVGLEAAAMRTYAGRMRVLGEQGDFQAALEAGAILVNWLTTVEAVPTATLPKQEADALRALVKNQQGICYDQLGQFQAALAAFQEAETLYAALEMPKERAGVKNNQGLALLYMGNVHAALTALTTALAIQRAEDLILPQAHTQSNLGEAYLLLGNYRAALAAYEEARKLLAAQAAWTDEQINLRQMADTYLALNLYDEALVTYREVAQQLARAEMTHERAWALWGMGAALAAQHQLAAAAAALAEAAALFAAVHNIPLLTGVRLEQAALLAQQGDRQAAEALTTQALAEITTAEWPVQQFFTYLRWIDLRLATLQSNASALVADELPQIEAQLGHAQRLSARLALPHLRYRLAQRLGQLRLLQGRTAEAIRILEQTVEAIEQLRNTLPLETMRISFLHDKLTAYETLVQLYLARGTPDDFQRAFDMAERARSRTLLERMIGLVEGQSATTDDQAIEQQLALLRADLNAIYSRLLQQEGADEQASPPERSRYSENLHLRAITIEQEISRLRLLHAAPQTGELLSASPIPISAIQTQLAEDRALVAYYLLADEIMAFVVVRNQLQVVRHLSVRQRVEPLLQRLYAQWQRFRAGGAFVARHLPLLEQSTQRILHALYEELFAPVDVLLTHHWPEQDTPLRLTIIPHGLLHQAPFQAFYDGHQSLLVRYQISYAPSAATAMVAPRRQPRTPANELVMGVIDPDIPAIQREVALIAAQCPQAQIYLNDQATVGTFMQQAPMARLIHLACHGIFRTDNPMFSALRLGDSWLTALEVAQLQLQSELVVLSACESGRGQTPHGDEILGLARAFFSAGAATLVVSQWMVQDEAAARLMAAFYAHWVAGHAVDAALRLAQLAVQAQYAHPYYWAPFVVMGNDQAHWGR
ncbi:MAG: CHAT domain-containing protein [Caldilineaceae bacterium]